MLRDKISNDNERTIKMLDMMGMLGLGVQNNNSGVLWMVGAIYKS